jgi:hypothetical protein
MSIGAEGGTGIGLQSGSFSIRVIEVLVDGWCCAA